MNISNQIRNHHRHHHDQLSTITYPIYIMSFSGLPRELRNIIFQKLLCPPDGVHLQHVDRDPRMRKFKADVFSIIDHGDDNSEEDEEDHLDSGIEKNEPEEWDESKMISLWQERWQMSNLDLSTVTSLPTAIFYVNHQIREEASEVFYGGNRFTFATSARAALHFLKSLRPNYRRDIRNLGFTRRSTVAGDHDCTISWSPLCDFIIHHMSINSVTIQAPRHPWLEIDKTKPAEDAPNTGRYWWPAPRLLIAALMAGKIQQLRIAYLATLRLGDSIEESGYQETEDLRHKNPVENLETIHNLRYPRPQEELDREALEGKALRSAIARGQRHKFDSMTALVADQETRRQRFNFVVTREDDPVGDLGTVLVLTRPTASLNMRIHMLNLQSVWQEIQRLT